LTLRVGFNNSQHWSFKHSLLFEQYIIDANSARKCYSFSFSPILVAIDQGYIKARINRTWRCMNSEDQSYPQVRQTLQRIHFFFFFLISNPYKEFYIHICLSLKRKRTLTHKMRQMYGCNFKNKTAVDFYFIFITSISKT
jgi:hypothetical protein